MMKLRFMLIALIASMTLSVADEAPKPRTGTLLSVEGDTAVTDIADIPVGVSGIVIHRYDKSHAAIVASVMVTQSDSAQSRHELLPYKGLEQPRLPTVKTRPIAGDRVILGYMYDRVLPIVPNQKSLEKAKKSFPYLNIIHPDLVAAELAKEKSPLPNRKVLQHTCEKFDLGLVMIMFADRTDFLDCISWTRLKTSSIKADDPDQFKQPFFHRFDALPTAFYDWSEYKMQSFDKFYARLEKKE